jgi:hypothetical protein
MPEYGGTDGYGVDSQLQTFKVSALGPLTMFLTAGPVPPDETWVVQGVDFYGQGIGLGFLVVLFGPGTGYTYADSVGYGTPGGEYVGAFWRGNMPIGTGEYAQAQATLTAAGVGTGITIWGVKLPFSTS